jgi:hypothetical protein
MKKHEGHSPEETEKRYRAIIRGALHTPPSPLKDMPRRRKEYRDSYFISQPKLSCLESGDRLSVALAWLRHVAAYAATAIFAEFSYVAWPPFRFPH